MPAERLIEAVRLVASGSLLLGPSVTRRMVEELGSQKRSTPPPNLPLTPRELDVLRLVATGKSNAEIAATLVLSPETIKSHVAEILRKLHVRTGSRRLSTPSRTASWTTARLELLNAHLSARCVLTTNCPRES